MNNGIDLDAIPGQKAARNRGVVQNPPSKPRNVSNRNRNPPRANNNYIQARPHRHVPQYGNRYYNSRPYVPTVRNRSSLSQPYYNNQQNSARNRLVSFIGEAVVLCVVVCTLVFLGFIAWDIFTFVGEQLLEPVFTFVSEQLFEPASAYVSDNWNTITDIGSFLWKWMKIIFLCYVVLVILFMIFGDI